MHGSPSLLPFRTLPAVALLFALFGGASTVSAQAVEPDSLPSQVTPERMQAGYELFQEASCRACHGDMGRGSFGGPSLQDREWLHSDGDYDGIFQSIRWGVKSSELKAQTRMWEMRPRGGMLFNTEQMESIAAYIWGQRNGLYERTSEDHFVDYVMVRSAEEAWERYRELRDSTGEIPFTEARMGAVARDIAEGAMELENADEFDRAVELLNLVIDAYPESATSHFRLAQVAAFRGDTEEAIAQARRALELNPELTGAQNLLQQLGGGGGS